MEPIVAKRGKKRKRKRRVGKRRVHHGKIEVISRKRQKLASDYNNTVKERNTLAEAAAMATSTMESSSFWLNYSAAHEWQKKHSATWWRTRCFALEYENHVLKETIRNLVRNHTEHQGFQNAAECQQNTTAHQKESSGIDNCSEEEGLEFHLNDDMMTFIEQSMRHKMELKKTREKEAADEAENAEENSAVEGGFTWAQERLQDAKLLYGDASSTILAMETALQATIDRHKDRSKPQYWPNLPLRL